MVKGYYLIVAKELRALGFAYASNAKGSHEKWIREGVILIVPRHLHARPLANAILRQAGSNRRV